MHYKLLYTQSAVKDIHDLDVVVKKRLKSKIEDYTQNPMYHAKKLTHSKLGDYRWRVGNYRIVFDIDESNIIILRVGHRREIYR